jgi:hypothetical protein
MSSFCLFFKYLVVLINIKAKLINNCDRTRPGLLHRAPFPPLACCRKISLSYLSFPLSTDLSYSTAAQAAWNLQCF